MMKKPDWGTSETNIFQASIESDRTKNRLPAIAHLLAVIMAVQAIREMTMAYAMTGITRESLLPSIIKKVSVTPKNTETIYLYSRSLAKQGSISLRSE